jgi:hypothetical protein
MKVSGLCGFEIDGVDTRIFLQYTCLQLLKARTV